MQLTDALALAEKGRGQAQVSYHEEPFVRPEPRPERVDAEPDPGPFHDTLKMVADAQAALDDPASWLTHGYTCALHLRFLLVQLGLWDAPPVRRAA